MGIVGIAGTVGELVGPGIAAAAAAAAVAARFAVADW